MLHHHAKHISQVYFFFPLPFAFDADPFEATLLAREVNGFDNLSAMEIDPNGSIQDLLAGGGESGEDAMAGLGGMGNMMQDLAFSVCLQ